MALTTRRRKKKEGRKGKRAKGKRQCDRERDKKGQKKDKDVDTVVHLNPHFGGAFLSKVVGDDEVGVEQQAGS